MTRFSYNMYVKFLYLLCDNIEIVFDKVSLSDKELFDNKTKIFIFSNLIQFFKNL